MPQISNRARRASAERVYQTAMDWTRKIMQLAGLATLLLYAYLIYGLFFGGVGDWVALKAVERAHFTANIQGAVLYLNIALGTLLVTLCILYYDEEAFGYMLVGIGIALYYGVPYLIDTVFNGQLQAWQKTHNFAALSIFGQFKVAGLMCAIPGAILAVRDLGIRLLDRSRRDRETFDSMQYGGSVKEEAPVGAAPIGLFAKCWQFSYCREAIRKNCPIYHARTRCWRERVGCMCEENVIRHAMDSLINKELITKTDPADTATIAEGVVIGSVGVKDMDKTTELPSRVNAPPPSPRHVKIPHNPNISMAVKVARCRNCVIYNEHQRFKYQFLAPLFVLALPALALWKMDLIQTTLNSLLQSIDRVMTNLSLDPNAHSLGLANSIASNGAIAQFAIIACLVVIVTSMVLRWLEYAIFKLKL